MLYDRRNLIESLVPYLIENNVSICRTKIKKFMNFHQIKNIETFNAAFPFMAEFLNQYISYEAMI